MYEIDNTQAVGGPLYIYGQPFKGSYDVTSYFGEKRTTTVVNEQNKKVTSWRFHLGVDLLGREGYPNSPVFAIKSGVIRHAGWQNSSNHKEGYGWYIAIDHDEDPFCTIYGHMLDKALSGIVVGSRVNLGQHIGYQGNTGTSSGPHLHLEIMRLSFADRGKKQKHPADGQIGSTRCLDPIYILSAGKDNSGNYNQGACQPNNTPRYELVTDPNGDTRIAVNAADGDLLGGMYNLAIGGTKLLSPSDDERKYGVSVYDTVQALIRSTTAEGVNNSPDVYSALGKYAKYIYYYLNSSIALANVQTVSMPWIRPGFNVWLDPLFIDRIYYVNSVQHMGNNQSGVFTTLGLTFGRSRKNFQKIGYQFGSLNPNRSDNVFINTIFVRPSNFSKNVLESERDFNALKAFIDKQYQTNDSNLRKSAFDPHYQYLYNTINTEAGTVTGEYQSPAIGGSNTINDLEEASQTNIEDTSNAFDGTFKKGDIVIANGKAYDKSVNPTKSVPLDNVRGSITMVTKSSATYQYHFENKGWVDKKSLKFISRTTPSSTMKTLYASPAATAEFDSIGEIENWLNKKYENAPTVVKNRIAKHNKIMESAKVYIEKHYIKE